MSVSPCLSTSRADNVCKLAECTEPIAPPPAVRLCSGGAIGKLGCKSVRKGGSGGGGSGLMSSNFRGTRLGAGGASLNLGYVGII